MSDEVFQRYGHYYDLLYRDKDYAAEADYVIHTLRGAAPGARAVLEFGSGTGKHGGLLARAGYDVFGIERSESMVAAARQRPPGPPDAGSFECASGDIRDLHLSRLFDVTLALFHVVSYQTGNADLLRTFASAARHLRPGGQFMFDVWHGPAVLQERPAVRVKRVEDEKTRLTRVAEPALDCNTSIVTVRYTMLAEGKSDGRLTTFGEEHRMRYLFPTEIELLAGQTGFEVLRSEEFLTGKPPSDKTWGVVYLLRKHG